MAFFCIVFQSLEGELVARMVGLDTFGSCRKASDKAAWPLEEVVAGLDFDFSRRFLPLRICGHEVPAWMTEAEQLKLNQLRGYSYAHMFLVVEEFIIEQTCATASKYVHVDSDAVSAIIKFADEELKHQRLFSEMKTRLVNGFGFTPVCVTNKEEIARQICGHSEFAVYLLCLVLEWMTQRHYLECYQDEEKHLDQSFVSVFRLHWVEEVQHARLDTILLNEMAAKMSEDELTAALVDFQNLIQLLTGLLEQQNKCDVENYERLCGPLSRPQREELFEQMEADWMWTFLVSGLEHKGFQRVYERGYPNQIHVLEEVIASLSRGGNTIEA